MPLNQEMRDKLNTSLPDVAKEVDSLIEELASVTRESLDRKNKIRAFEANQKTFNEKMKTHGIDPEQDIEDQLKRILDTAKTGMKPVTEFEQLSKKFDKVMSELDSWKTQADLSKKEAKIEKAKSAFSSKLPDHFGDASELILDYAVMKGLVGVNEEGVAGLNYDGDFIPITSDKGKNAIDVLKQLYPKFAIVKQKGGTGTGGGTGNGAGGSGDLKTYSMQEFEALPHAMKQQVTAAVAKGEAKIE